MTWYLPTTQHMSRFVEHIRNLIRIIVWAIHQLKITNKVLNSPLARSDLQVKLCIYTLYCAVLLKLVNACT